MIVKTIRRGLQAAAIAIRPAKILMVGISLGALLTVSNFVQTTKAQQSNTAREQVIRECNLMEKRAANEPQEGTKTGGRQFVYKGCMADHGQGE
jgi:predicted alpha/beta-fold hydrolase